MAAILAVIACEERADFAAPFGAASGDRGVDMARLNRLRQIGEGCTIAAADSLGVFRAFAVPRGQLPMSLPAISRDAGGQGNGRQYRTVIRRRSGSDVTMTCWAPDTLSVQQFAKAVHSSLANPGWKGLLNRLTHAPALAMPSERKPLSPEALAFLRQMADPGSDSGVTATTLSQTGPRIVASPGFTRQVVPQRSATRLIAPVRPSRDGLQDCTFTDEDTGCSCDVEWVTYYYLDATYTTTATVCVDIGGDDGWTIDLSFFIEEDYLSDDDYVYLLDTGELSPPTYACSGTDTPNEIDNLVNQYTTYSQAVTPDCDYFSYRPDGFVGWARVQSHETPTPNYAIYMSVLDNNIHQLQIDTAFDMNAIVSMYRTPYNNFNIPHAAHDSQHIYGTAVDITVVDSLHWDRLRNHWSTFLVPVPCAEPWPLAHSHVHFDFRGAPGVLYDPGCAPAWVIQ